MEPPDYVLRCDVPEVAQPGLPTARTAVCEASEESVQDAAGVAAAQRARAAVPSDPTNPAGCQRSHDRRVDWDCGVLAPQRWCLYNVRHSYDYSAAAHFPRESVYVCTKLIRDNNGALVGRACGYDFAGLDVAKGGLRKPLIYNGDPDKAHTIDGGAEW
jgi:hypothetical protein